MQSTPTAKSNIMGVVLAATILAAPVGVAVYRSTPTEPPVVEPDVIEPVVVVPNTIRGLDGPVKVGEMVRLTIEGDQVQWLCLPEVEDVETYGDANDQCVLSFRHPGKYTVLACVIKDDKLALESVDVQVGGLTPTPAPDSDELQLDVALSGTVTQWANESGGTKEQLEAVAASFEQVAQEIQAGSITTAEAVVQRTVALNREHNLSGLEVMMAKAQAEITNRAQAGKLETMDQHVVTWLSIADGLRNANPTPTDKRPRL